MKPMLAYNKTPDLKTLSYPMIASPKIDGIRCLTFEGGVPATRALKNVPNQHIHRVLIELGIAGLDGELWIPGAKNFGEVSSAVMSRTGEPYFEYNVFDVWDSQEPYDARLRELAKRIAGCPRFVRPVPVITCQGPEDVEVFEQKCLDIGFEGVMLRKPNSPYKHGRSTLNEGYLLKVKRWEDAEAELIGVVEELENQNELQTDNLGHAKRSTHKDNKVAKGSLGAMVCRRPDGLEFRIGTGFTQEQREVYWAARDMIIGKLVKYKYQPAGAKEAPRFPGFLGFRAEEDLS